MRVAWSIAIIVLAGCGANPSGSSTSSGSLPGSVATSMTAITSTSTTEPTEANDGLAGEWRAISGVVGGEAVQLIDSSPITLVADGSKLSGTAACNQYELKIEPRPVGVEIVELSHNEMGCEPPIAALEELFLGSFAPFRSTATYVIEGSVLTWETTAATWRFGRVAPIPPAPLVGTRWVLSSVTYEFGAMWSSGMEEGHIVFAGDGTFTGSTSCRPFAGRWSLEGPTVVVSGVVLEGRCAERLAQVDGIVARVLGEGLRASIDGNHLLARPRRDLGLEFITAQCTDEVHRRSCFEGELMSAEG